MKSLTIGHLAREAGINLGTVRYYKRRGLLPKPPRSASGYRLFPVEAARRLRFIRRAQELGFSLREIQELLSLRVSLGKTSADVRASRAEAKITDIQSKIKRALSPWRRRLRKLTKTCTGCGPIVQCPILESLEKGMHEPNMEARSVGTTWRRCFAASETGLPHVLACLSRIADFGWPWIPHIQGVPASCNHWVPG